MATIHNKQPYIDRRRELRKNATPEETIMWHHLRAKKLGYKFNRQHSIGIYIADFYCAEKKLIIELDGQQHNENNDYDVTRTIYLENLGMKVIRFWNHEINKNLKGVLEAVVENLNK